MTRARDPLLVAGLVGAYLAVFHRFGLFDFADEGLQLAQAWRVAHGEHPYVDFHTGYGPLHFLLGGALMRLGGLGAVRAALAAVHVGSAVLVFVLARRLAGPAMAWLAIALQVAFFLPVAPATGAPFYVPYPAWYAEVAGLAVATILSRAGPIRPWASALAGLVIGTTCAIKLSSGLLFGVGAVLTLALARPEGRISRWAGACAACAVVAVGAILGEAAARPIGWVLLAPIVMLVGLGRHRGSADLASFVGLALGAATGLAVWLAPLLVALGSERFAREVLLIGAGVAQVYAVAPPAAIWIGSFVGIVAAQRGLVAPRTAAIVGGFALVVVAVVGGMGSDARSPGAALRVGVDSAAFAAAVLACWGAVRRLGGASSSVLLAPTALGVTAMVQLFPRPDGLHLLSIAPLVLPVGVYVLHRALTGFPRGWRRVVVALCFLVAGVRSAPTLALAGRAAGGARTVVILGREWLWATPEGATRLRAAATAAQAVHDRVPAGGVVLGFPACAAVTYFADRASAGPHDYYFPGRPTRAEVAALVDGWQDRPPPVAVSCTADATDLAQAWAAYPEMTSFLNSRYAPFVTALPFTVHEVRR